MSSAVVCRWEPLVALLDDGLERLVVEHHAEVGVHKDEMPLACDWDWYRAQEKLGVLRTLAARIGDDLVGYNSFFVRCHPHYARTLHAMGDAIFVTKTHRSTGAGVSLIDQAERDLIELARPGWVRITYHDKAHLEYLGPVLRKRGYGAIETLYDKIVKG